MLNFGALIDQMLGPGDNPAHANHIHMSTWPKMKSNWWYRPPCKGGKLVVINEDGSRGDTFGPPPPPPPPPTMGDDMALRRNDTGNAVTRHQEALLAWRPSSLPRFGADGDFGAETEAAVTEYQKAADLDGTQDNVAGIIDGITSNLLLEWIPDRAVATHDHDPADPPPLVPHAHDDLYAFKNHPHKIVDPAIE